MNLIASSLTGRSLARSSGVFHQRMSGFAGDNLPLYSLASIQLPHLPTEPPVSYPDSNHRRLIANFRQFV